MTDRLERGWYVIIDMRIPVDIDLEGGRVVPTDGTIMIGFDDEASAVMFGGRHARHCRAPTEDRARSGDL